MTETGRKFVVSSDLPELEQPQAITMENLIHHIKILTDNQNHLMSTISSLKSESDDPFLNFKTPDPIKNLPTFSGNKKETHA